MKTCTKCKVAKPEEAFSHKGTGRRSRCRDCTKAYQRAYYKANPDKFKRYSKKASLNLRGKWRKAVNNQRKTESECTITFEDYCSLLNGCDWLCSYCSGSLRELSGHSLDRIDNLRGYHLDNVVPCCWECNHKRRDLDFDEWLAILNVNDIRGTKPRVKSAPERTYHSNG